MDESPRRPLAEPRRALDKGPPGRHKCGTTVPVTVCECGPGAPDTLKFIGRIVLERRGQVADEIASPPERHLRVDWFPTVRKGLSRAKLQELGARMVELRKTAPRSPAQPSALKKVVDAVIA